MPWTIKNHYVEMNVKFGEGIWLPTSIFLYACMILSKTLKAIFI